MSVQVMRDMFEQMVVAKDISLAPRYYHPDFQLTTNGQEQDYAAFVAGHERVYATPISYAFSYDDDAWIETVDRVAGRMWVTTTRPGEDPTTLELIFIATFLDGRIRQLWELTWPDWSQLKAFETY